MTALIGAVFLASLLGSLHCGGMCGAFAAFAVGALGNPDRKERGRFWPYVAYHGGRLLVYAILGCLAGFAGAALDKGGTLIGIQRFAAIAAGAMMMVFGAPAVAQLLGLRWRIATPAATLGRWLQRAQAVAIRQPVLQRAGWIGLLTALLPCGWLYAFVVAAAGTGHPLWGALTMAAFWAGTVPVLVSVAVGVQKLTGMTGRRVQLAASLVVIVMGVLTVIGRWDLPVASSNSAAAKPPETVEEAAEHVKKLDHREAPCCQNDR